MLFLVCHLCSVIGAEDEFLDFAVDSKTQDVALYWKDEKGAILKSILNLKNYVERQNRQLVFAMNGGMYKEDRSPAGLFIQDQKVLAQLNRDAGMGNFYLKPNGVFFITSKRQAFICKTEDFTDHAARADIVYATQSGPMLVVGGRIHPAFKEGSDNVNIRNGVGILPDGRVLFAMSRNKVNFYDFARHFRDKGCEQALFLDGFVCRTYLPREKWVQTDGSFGVMIGVTALR